MIHEECAGTQKVFLIKKNYIIIAFTDVTKCFLSWKKSERTKEFRMNPSTLMMELAIQIICEAVSFIVLFTASLTTRRGWCPRTGLRVAVDEYFCG